MSTNDERLANETLALADEIETDAKREIGKIDALIGAAMDSDDFDGYGVGFLLVQKSLEQSRLANAGEMRACAVEFKSIGVKN